MQIYLTILILFSIAPSIAASQEQRPCIDYHDELEKIVARAYHTLRPDIIEYYLDEAWPNNHITTDTEELLPILLERVSGYTQQILDYTAYITDPKQSEELIEYAAAKYTLIQKALDGAAALYRKLSLAPRQHPQIAHLEEVLCRFFLAIIQCPALNLEVIDTRAAIIILHTITISPVSTPASDDEESDRESTASSTTYGGVSAPGTPPDKPIHSTLFPSPLSGPRELSGSTVVDTLHQD
jgi:hypothetical protein